ncbi:MAG TPA: carboxypeptidase-like regulatory domain-containing protein, partial [Pyrinomonadaceae bacterium]|nr:carboxypeptidase-like regulatory domain-containing protein [Pyrinomonadaceae bacterium]
MLPLLALIIALAFPQGDTGQLSGTVIDPNDAAIPNASIKLINHATSQVRDLTTKDSGDFAFTLLPPGRYKLEVTANGFTTVQID